jgi:hypothetical protein
MIATLVVSVSANKSSSPLDVVDDIDLGFLLSEPDTKESSWRGRLESW